MKWDNKSTYTDEPTIECPVCGEEFVCDCSFECEIGSIEGCPHCGVELEMTYEFISRSWRWAVFKEEK